MSGYVDSSVLPRSPRWTPLQAVAYALGQVQHPDANFEGMCDHFSTWCYGYAGSGWASAWVHFQSIPMQYRHSGTNAPRGAFVFWNVGAYGHIAVSVGGGRCASTDIIRLGKVDVVPIDYVTSRWGAHYLGWTQPWVANSFGTNPNTPRPASLHPTRLRPGVRPGASNPQVVDVKLVLGRWRAMRGQPNPWHDKPRTPLYGAGLRAAVLEYHHSRDGKAFAAGPHDDSIGPNGWDHIQRLVGRQ